MKLLVTFTSLCLLMFTACSPEEDFPVIEDANPVVEEFTVLGANASGSNHMHHNIDESFFFSLTFSDEAEPEFFTKITVNGDTSLTHISTDINLLMQSPDEYRATQVAFWDNLNEIVLDDPNMGPNDFSNPYQLQTGDEVEFFFFLRDPDLTEGSFFSLTVHLD